VISGKANENLLNMPITASDDTRIKKSQGSTFSFKDNLKP
jgi:hypothetical protein